MECLVYFTSAWVPNIKRLCSSRGSDGKKNNIKQQQDLNLDNTIIPGPIWSLPKIEIWMIKVVITYKKRQKKNLTAI